VRHDGTVNALVTGGAGFIGGAIARALIARGSTVTVIDNLIGSAPDRVPTGARFIEGDIRDLQTVTEAARGADVVFHQAALRSVPQSVDDPVLTTECNVVGTMNVLIAAQRQGAGRVVYASSSSAYGDEAATPQQEDARPNPISPYAASKLAGEHYCRVWTKVHGLPTVSLRYFNVFGPGQNPESKYAAVFPLFIRALLRGEAPVVHWDGEQSRDFTFIDDVVAANLAAVTVDGDRLREMGGAVVNIAGGGPRSINEILRSVADAVGTWIEPERTPRRAGDIRSSHADIARARELLGWEPTTTFEDAVARTVASIRDQ
jgi:nucleoside-diphosphate-sugar epimerase